MSEAWLEVLEEVNEHASLVAGWRGPGTAAVSVNAAMEATTLVRLFALELPDGPHPMIGADDEGSVGFTWHEANLIGNLSVTGNGRFAYFVQRGEQVVKHGSVAIQGSLPSELVGILRA